MKTADELILGIDICDRYSQVSYYDDKTQTAESVPLNGKVMLFENPVPLHIISEDAVRGEPVRMEELTRLAGILLENAKKFRNFTEAERICITVSDFQVTILDALKTAFSYYGYTSDKLSFMSHEESYAYYAFSMKRELWNGGVTLFHYDEGFLETAVLSNIRYKEQDIIVEETHTFENEYFQEVMSGEKTLYDIEELLLSAAKETMNGKVISSVYLTGKGFDVENYPSSFIQFLCNRHRVFAGQNLYVKGACIAAYESKYHSRFAGTIFACRNRIATGIDIEIEERGKPRLLRVVRPGMNWYEADKTLNFIVDDCNQIRLHLHSVAVKNSREEIIELNDFPYRPGKTTRIGMEFRFTAQDRCYITIKDKGFGEIAKSSGKIIYKDLNL